MKQYSTTEHYWHGDEEHYYELLAVWDYEASTGFEALNALDILDMDRNAPDINSMLVEGTDIWNYIESKGMDINQAEEYEYGY